MLYLKKIKSRNLRLVIYILIFVFFFVNNVFSQKYLKISVNENENIENFEFKKYEKKYSDSLAVISAISDFRNNLFLSGFLASSIDTISTIKDTICVNINIGKQYKWGSFNYNHSNISEFNTVNTTIKKLRNKIVNLNEYAYQLENIINYYEAIGYPFISAGFKNVSFNDSIIEADLFVEKNQKYFVKNILLKGNAKIKLPYLYNFLDIYPESVYNCKKSDLISKKISDSPFLEEIKHSEIEYSDSTIDLFLYLKNKKANSFNGIIGFMPESDKSKKLSISGDIDFSIWNMRGRGEHLIFNWKRPSELTQKLNLNFSYPYLFYTKIGVETNFSLYKQDTSFLNIKSDIGVRFDFSQNQYLKIFLEYKSSNTINNIGVISNQTNSNADISSVLYGLEYKYSNLDYTLNPSSGITLEMYGAFGKKKISNFSGLDSLFNKNTIQIETGLNSSCYIPVYRNIVFRISADLRYMSSLDRNSGSNLIFENELFRFGGAKSLRGFDEDVIRASFYVLNNLELRYNFEKNSSFYIFCNGAYYKKHTVDNNISDYPYGFGLGADIEMRAGIFSIGYALGKQFDNPIQIKSAKIYFGYKTIF